MIGTLQTNKVNQAIHLCDCFHALDSKKLADELIKGLNAKNQKDFNVFLEVNIDSEESKSGMRPEEVDSFLEIYLKRPEITILGLMCIPKANLNESATRSSFQHLAELAKTLSAKHGTSLKLNMGMSDDFELAIQEGADYVRVGRGIFGDRPSR